MPATGKLPPVERYVFGDQRTLQFGQAAQIVEMEWPAPHAFAVFVVADRPIRTVIAVGVDRAQLDQSEFVETISTRVVLARSIQVKVSHTESGGAGTTANVRCVVVPMDLVEDPAIFSAGGFIADPISGSPLALQSNFSDGVVDQDFGLAFQGMVIFNDSAANLYVLLGTSAATTTVFTVRIPPGGTWETPFGWGGHVHGIWDADTANGAARVTQVVRV